MIIEIGLQAIPSVVVLVAIGGTFYRVGLVKRQVDLNTELAGKCEVELKKQGERLSRIEGFINGQSES